MILSYISFTESVVQCSADVSSFIVWAISHYPEQTQIMFLLGRMVGLTTNKRRQYDHLVHCAHKTSGEDGEDETGYELEDDAVQPEGEN